MTTPTASGRDLVVVTGTSGGLGQAISARLLEQYDVVGIARRDVTPTDLAAGSSAGTYHHRCFDLGDIDGIGPLIGAWLLPWLGLVIAATPFALLLMDIDFSALTTGNSSQLPDMTGTRGAFGILIIVGLAIFLLTQFWYRAAEVRHFAASTEFDELRFDSTLSGFNVFWPYFFYGLLLVLLWAGAIAIIASIVTAAAVSGGVQGNETAQMLGSFAGGFAASPSAWFATGG